MAATLALLFGLSNARPAFAIDPTVESQLACSSAQGLVLCTVNVQPSYAAHITWADALIVNAPPVVRPVNTKTSYEDTTKEPHMVLVFSAVHPGTGPLFVRLRAVVCADDGTSCPSYTRLLKATIRVPHG